MTTITNFLHSSFLDKTHTQLDKDKEKQDFEVPIWVVNGNRSMNVRGLKEYMIEHCIGMGRAVLRLDFGITVLRVVRECQVRIPVEEGFEIVVPYKDKPYYILTLNSQFRKNTNTSIPTIITTLTNIPTLLSKLPTPTPSPLSLSLIIQSLEIIATEHNGPQMLESFINHLSSLNPAFKQITVFKCGEILEPEHEFALERISTCFTEIERYEGNGGGEWAVRSTVRRATGFSNQERYGIRVMKNGKLKVEKFVAKEEEEALSHKQMVSELGFVVKKADQAHKTQDIKQMIYPHLRVQNLEPTSIYNCKCNKKQCKNCSKECEQTQVQGLIILDDEQEDDDDIDV